MERILGIDYGDSRTGIAVSDLMGWTAQGVETITYKGDYKLLLKRIEELIKEYDIKKILIGSLFVSTVCSSCRFIMILPSPSMQMVVCLSWAIQAPIAAGRPYPILATPLLIRKRASFFIS